MSATPGEEVRAVDEIASLVAELRRCTCIPAYKDRDLDDPQCHLHSGYNGESADMIESLRARAERAEAERDEYRIYYAAVRAAHNGYDAEARSVMPSLREPESPAEAIAELREEAESIGRESAERERDALVKDAQRWRLYMRHHSAEFVAGLTKELDEEIASVASTDPG